jgi:hypothetical protein
MEYLLTVHMYEYFEPRRSAVQIRVFPAFVMLSTVAPFAVAVAKHVTSPSYAASVHQTTTPGPSADSDPEARVFVADLIGKMTFEEKIGQMSQVALNTKLDEPVNEIARKGQAGSFLFITNPAEINRLQHIAVEVAVGIAAFIDSLGPPAVAFPCVFGHMRRRHSSHVSATPGAEASVKAARTCAPRSGRSALTDAGAEGTSPRMPKTPSYPCGRGSR